MAWGSVVHPSKGCRRGLATEALGALVAALGLGAALPASAQRFETPSGAERFILDQTLAYRASKGVQAVSVKSAANRAADRYALFLAEKRLSGHEADGRTPADRVKAENGKFCGIWENVHESSTWPRKAPWRDAMEKATTFWKTSPGHEENLKRAEADGIGIGVRGWKHGDQWHYKSVQVFLKTKC